MEMHAILSPQKVLAHLKPNSKKQLLQELAEHSAPHIGISEQLIFDTLLERERLGSTGIGNGVAIPHGKFSELKEITGVFAKLQKPISFDAMDDQPIDIVFMLLAPEGSGVEHLKALSRIARVLRRPSTLNSIRSSNEIDTIYSLLTAQENADAA